MSRYARAALLNGRVVSSLGFRQVSSFAATTDGRGFQILVRNEALPGLVEELAERVSTVDELADAAALVRREVAAYLGWRFGGWSIS